MAELVVAAAHARGLQTAQNAEFSLPSEFT